MSTVERAQHFTRDPETAYELISRAYASRLDLAGLVPGDPLSLTCHDLGRVRLSKCSSPARVRWATRGLDRLVITQPLDGSQERRMPGLHDRLRPGDIAVIAPPRHPARGVHRALAHRTVSIDLGLLSSLTAQAGPTALPREVADCRPLSPQAGRRWSQVVDMVDDVITHTDGGALLHRQAERFLAATALALFVRCQDAAGPGAETSIDRTDATPLVLKRSIEFMEANADREITVTDVAEATNVSVRAVQLAFQRHLQTTPMAHLRRIRIHHAHRELRIADPTCGDTVADIAARWGFFSPGRFSAQYREIYGVPPSQTLRT